MAEVRKPGEVVVKEGDILRLGQGDGATLGIVTRITQDPIESHDGTWNWQPAPTLGVAVANALKASGVNSESKYPAQVSPNGDVYIVSVPEEEAEKLRRASYCTKATLVDGPLEVVDPNQIPLIPLFSYGN